MRRKIVLCGAFVFVAIIAGAGIWIFMEVKSDIEWLDQYGKEIQKKLGFQLGSPYILTSLGSAEYPTFEVLSKTSPLQAVGVNQGDVLLNYGGTEFLKLLYEHQGLPVTFEVVSGGFEPEIERRERRKIILLVP